VSNPNGGAVAFIGGSDTDLAYAGSRIVEKGIERLDIRLCTLYQEGIMHLGDLWGLGLIAYEPLKDDIVDIITILQNHLFGDPSLQIAEGDSQPPLTPNPPIGTIEGKIHTDYEFSAVTSDPEGDDLYYLFDFGDNEQIEWIGPYSNGESCFITHTWTEKGSYAVRVKAKDSDGLMSDWSDPAMVSMPKSTFLIERSLLKSVRELQYYFLDFLSGFY